MSKSATAVVARSTFRSQNVQNTIMFGPLIDVQMASPDVEKVHAVVARSTFGSQMCQKLTCSGFEIDFDVSDVVLLADSTFGVIEKVSFKPILDVQMWFGSVS